MRTVLHFQVRSSSGSGTYQIEAIREGANFAMTCTCEAGANGMVCKHRSALLAGEVTALVSPNTMDVERLRDLVRGTDVESRLTEVGVLERELESVKKRLSAATKALAREMNS